MLLLLLTPSMSPADWTDCVEKVKSNAPVSTKPTRSRGSVGKWMSGGCAAPDAVCWAIPLPRGAREPSAHGARAHLLHSRGSILMSINSLLPDEEAALTFLFLFFIDTSWWLNDLQKTLNLFTMIKIFLFMSCQMTYMSTSSKQRSLLNVCKWKLLQDCLHASFPCFPSGLYYFPHIRLKSTYTPQMMNLLFPY